MPRRYLRFLIVFSLLSVAASHAAPAGDDDATLDGLIRSYLASRGAEPQLAPPAQLARRYAIDLTGVVPDPDDVAAVEGMAPGEMFDYFASRPAMAHTAGERPYVWSRVLRDADHFLFSNSTQFSQVGHIRELRDQLRRVYDEGWSYQELARWVLQSQAFLNRFPSAADRANAAFFLFLGRDSFASEVPVGNMWNGYVLRNPDIPANQAESNADYHVHDYDAARCSDGSAVCDAELWSVSGNTPEQAIDLIVSSPLFAEATVDRYWLQLIGGPLPGVDFPEVRRVLVRGFVSHDYDVNWLVREISTSVVYTQEMMFR